MLRVFCVGQYAAGIGVTCCTEVGRLECVGGGGAAEKRGDTGDESETDDSEFFPFEFQPVG